MVVVGSGGACGVLEFFLRAPFQKSELAGQTMVAPDFLAIKIIGFSQEVLLRNHLLCA